MKKTTKTENNKPIFVTAYGPKKIINKGFKNAPSRTKQAFREECNINKIMAKYQKTGIIDHLNKYEGRYDMADGETFQEAMNLITDAQTMFNDLPSSIRNEFENNPARS